MKGDSVASIVAPLPLPPVRPLKIYCIINGRSGAGAESQREEVARAFAAHHEDRRVESVVEVCRRPRQLSAMVRRALDAGADVIAAGGGDGTVSTVANLVVGTPAALGVLPLGTLNHFAKDLGIPLDIPGAVRVICGGATARVDVGEVSGHRFINNSSLGVYPETLRVRERWRPRVGKWAALLIGSLTVLLRFPILRLRLDLGDRQLRRIAPLLFVGNNDYRLDWPATGARERIDAGWLSLLLMREASRVALLRSAWRVLRGRFDLAPEIEAARLTSFTVYSRRRRLRVAVDGEMLRLRPPLRYRSLPGALRVCVPVKSPDSPTR